MEEIIQWLIKIEKLASATYSKAAIYFVNNQTFSNFLEHAAEEEALHYHVMASAMEHNRSNPLPLPPISIDNDIKNNIEKQFNDIIELIFNQTLTEKEMMDAIISTEFSEWNDIFLYVVNSLKIKTNEFKYAVASIQNHLRVIENFFENSDYGSKSQKKIFSLPPVWTENILIVDDDAAISELLKAILNREGNIDIANNGETGLNKLNEKYYKLIISDVDMPVMDGITFYNKAINKFPNMKDRFLFLTGHLTPPRLDFFNTNHIKHLHKPSPISVIRKESLLILMRQLLV